MKHNTRVTTEPTDAGYAWRCDSCEHPEFSYSTFAEAWADAKAHSSSVVAGTVDAEFEDNGAFEALFADVPVTPGCPNWSRERRVRLQGEVVSDEPDFVTPIVMPGVRVDKTLAEFIGWTDEQDEKLAAALAEIREAERQAWISARDVWIH